MFHRGEHLISTLSKNRRLLAFCGVLEIVISALYLIMEGEDGPLTAHSWGAMILLLGKLAIVGGACTIATAFLRSREGKCWLLAVNGFALLALGLVQYEFTRYRISFLTIALLVIAMAASLGLLQLGIARNRRRQNRAADAWIFGISGAILFLFAVPALALGLRWIEFGPESHPDLLLLGLYFGWSAACKLGLALRLTGGSQPWKRVHPIRLRPAMR